LLIQSAITNHQSEILPVLLEVIVQTVADACAAAAGGADRLEIVRAIRSGGLTPPLALVTAIAAAVPLPLRVMVRENAGYDTDQSEVQALQRAAAEFAGAGVDGLVAGFSKRGALSVADLSVVLDAAPAVPVTFHRAFDAVSDPLAAIDLLARIPQIDGVLTSGGEGTPEARCTRLRDYSARAGARLAIVAGGGVDEEAFALFAKAACVRVIHVGRAARDGQNPEGAVSAARVRRLRDLADC
jgi:copper homeostasis protein